MKSVLFLLLLAPFASAASTSLQFVPAAQSLNEQRVLGLANGNVLIVGWSSRTQCDPLGNCSTGPQLPSLYILDASGNLVAAPANSAFLGSHDTWITGAAVDAGGNIWLTGTTDSDDFPLLHPLFSQKTPYASEGFLAKLDSNLNPLFATYLGAQTAQSVSRIALDSSGNAYVTGSTQDPNFPVTGPVLGTGAPGPSNNTTTPLTYGFVSKISPSGSQLLYSRLIGADQPAPCPSQMGCNEPAGTTIPDAIVVDSSGALTIAGSTNAMNFPVTAGVYQNTCNCPWPSSSNFVSRIAPDGSKLVWSTYLIPAGNSNATGAQFLSEDVAGNIYVAGSTVLQIVDFNGSLQTSSSIADAFAAKLNAQGTALLFEADWNGMNGAVLSGMELDPSGNLWLAGNTKAPNFPWLAKVPATGVDFALELNSTGSAPRQIQELLPGTVNRPIAFDSAGNLLLLSSKGSLLRLNPATANSAPALFAVANAAVLTADSILQPGEIVSLFGAGLGPPIGVTAMPDSNGRYPTQLAGVSV